MMSLPPLVLPVDLDPPFFRGRGEPEQEREDGPLAADRGVPEGVAFALAEETQRLRCQSRLLADLAPGGGERGRVGGVDAAGDRGEVVSAGGWIGLVSWDYSGKI